MGDRMIGLPSLCRLEGTDIDSHRVFPGLGWIHDGLWGDLVVADNSEKEKDKTKKKKRVGKSQK